MSWIDFDGNGDTPEVRTFDIKLRDGAVIEDRTIESVPEDSWAWIMDDSDIIAWRPSNGE